MQKCLVVAGPRLVEGVLFDIWASAVLPLLIHSDTGAMRASVLPPDSLLLTPLAALAGPALKSYST